MIAAHAAEERRGATRSGARALLLLSTPPNAAALRALADEPIGLAALRRATDSPSPTSLRTRLKELVAATAVEKRRRNRFPGLLEYELTTVGHELLLVASALDRWLADAPDHPLLLGEEEARTAVKALADSWSATILHTLVAEGPALSRLASAADRLSYPAVERRMSAMRRAGLAHLCPEPPQSNSYTVSDWLRRAAAPLLAAVAWEHRQRPRAPTPVAPIDAESIFLLALPGTHLHPDVSGSCELAIEVADWPDRAGVRAVVRKGEVASLSTRLRGVPDVRLDGGLAAWSAALVGGDADGPALGGRRELAQALLEGLRRRFVPSAGAPAA